MWAHYCNLITRSLVWWEISFAQLSLKATSQAKMASSIDVCLRDNDAFHSILVFPEIKIARYDFLLVCKVPNSYMWEIV